MLARLGLGGEDAREDVAVVHAAARRLRVTEFSLFHLAHRNWFGRDAEDKELERTFVAYLFHHNIPAWVRHFCREVIRGSIEAEGGPRPRPGLPWAFPWAFPRALPFASERWRHAAAMGLLGVLTAIAVALGARQVPLDCVAGAGIVSVNEGVVMEVAEDAGLLPCFGQR